jgi:hypothetical protein
MNAYEMEKLREHWAKPGNLQYLLKVLPLTPEGRAESAPYKHVVRMTGISYDEADFLQVYDMLEEDGVIARDAVQAPPAVEVVCDHDGPQVPCLLCQHRNRQARIKAGVRYHLTKPLAEY